MFRDKKKDGTTVITAGITLEDILDAVHPVGDIYMSVSSANPSTKFGGTWVAWGSGKVPVGFSSGETEFDTVEETGGAKTVTLTTAQIPSHTHAIDHDHPSTATSSDAVPAAVSTTDASTNPANTFVIDRGSSGDSISGQLISGSSHNHSFNVPAYTGDSGSAGTGGAHNNLQPYIVCYMWKRTA